MASRSRPSKVHSPSLDSLSFVQEADVDTQNTYFDLSNPDFTASDTSSTEKYYSALSPSYVLEDGPSVDAVRKEVWPNTQH